MPPDGVSTMAAIGTSGGATLSADARLVIGNDDERPQGSRPLHGVPHYSGYLTPPPVLQRKSGGAGGLLDALEGRSWAVQAVFAIRTVTD